jgi:hypothetical protein
LLIALIAIAVVAAYIITPMPAHAADKVRITVDTKPAVGYFHSTDWKYSTNTMYYKAEKKVLFQWPNAESLSLGKFIRVELQRLENGEWFPLPSRSLYVSKHKYAFEEKFVIEQDTPNVTSYRIHVDANAETNTEETYSPVFTVRGEKQSVGAVVKYSKSSQRYKKAPVTVTVSTTRAYTATAQIYDGKKKLKTLRIKNGNAVSWKLPKKLKKGTHKIKVKVTPGGEFKPFYKVYTSNVKKIKVKK